MNEFTKIIKSEEKRAKKEYSIEKRKLDEANNGKRDWWLIKGQYEVLLFPAESETAIYVCRQRIVPTPEPRKSVEEMKRIGWLKVFKKNEILPLLEAEDKAHKAQKEYLKKLNETFNQK